MPLEVNCLLTYYVEIDSISKVFVRGGIEEQGGFLLHKDGEFNCKHGKSGKERKEPEFGRKLVCKGGLGLDVEQFPRCAVRTLKSKTTGQQRTDRYAKITCVMYEHVS